MTKFKLGDRVTGIVTYQKAFKGDFVIDRIDYDPEDGYNYGISGRDRHGERLSTLAIWKGHELELITKGGAQVARRTFKLIKDTPGLRKGAIFQEKCDDGTQPYILITEAFKKSSSNDVRYGYADRSLVEGQSNWFVEVFQVEPQYMTREELDQWEAFKTRKSAERVVKRKYTRRAPVVQQRKNNWTPAKRKAHSEKLKAYWAAKKEA